jgi:hypothetical protein
LSKILFGDYLEENIRSEKRFLTKKMSDRAVLGAKSGGLLCFWMNLRFKLAISWQNTFNSSIYLCFFSKHNLLLSSRQYFLWMNFYRENFLSNTKTFKMNFPFW